MVVSGGALPDLLPGALDWLEDFYELHNDRQISMSMSGMHIGSIPATSVARMADKYPGEADHFRECLRAMDAAYLAYVRKPAGEKSAYTVNRSRTFGPDLMRSAGKK